MWLELGLSDAELLKNRLDLVQVPFTDMESRFLLFYDQGYFRLCLVEYETPLEKTTVLQAWSFTDNTGKHLDCSITSYPDRLECQTSIGVFRITFADPETLLVALPPGECGMNFKIYSHKVDFDAQGFVCKIQQPRELYLSCTTDARALEQNKFYF